MRPAWIYAGRPCESVVMAPAPRGTITALRVVAGRMVGLVSDGVGRLQVVRPAAGGGQHVDGYLSRSWLTEVLS